MIHRLNCHSTYRRNRDKRYALAAAFLVLEESCRNLFDPEQVIFCKD